MNGDSSAKIKTKQNRSKYFNTKIQHKKPNEQLANETQLKNPESKLSGNIQTRGQNSDNSTVQKFQHFKLKLHNSKKSGLSNITTCATITQPRRTLTATKLGFVTQGLGNINNWNSNAATQTNSTNTCNSKIKTRTRLHSNYQQTELSTTQ